jgi:GNAT superfamily N-acetyltransferase
MFNVKLLHAKETDAREIAQVIIDSWQTAYQGHLPDDYLNNLSINEKTKEWLENINLHNSQSAVLVAKIDDKIVGVCNFGPSRDEDANPQTGELYNLYILPKLMGQGIGTALLNKALELLRQSNFKKVILWTSVTNSKSRQFYEKRGWTNEGKIESGLLGDIADEGIRYFIEFSYLA